MDTGTRSEWPTEMHHYHIFGRRLRSELEFPDLSVAPAEGRADFELRIGPTKPPPVQTRLQGTWELEPGWVYRLHRLPAGFRLEFGSTGHYDILSRGREIVWYPGPDAPLEMIRALLLGPVMALALHEAGILALHGSAVTIEGEGIVFLGSKFHGKSTLALALTAAGAALVTDDLVAVEVEPPVLLPGIHSVRMKDDVAERLGRRFPGARMQDRWKKTLTGLPRHRLAWEPAPLTAVYVLEPVRRIADGAVTRRTRLPLPAAAAALAHQTKLVDELVGYETAGSTLSLIAAVVSRVPVYRLEVVRDLDSLGDVVRQIRSWRCVPPPSFARAAEAGVG